MLLEKLLILIQTLRFIFTDTYRKIWAGTSDLNFAVGSFLVASTFSFIFFFISLFIFFFTFFIISFFIFFFTFFCLSRQSLLENWSILQDYLGAMRTCQILELGVIIWRGLASVGRTTSYSVKCCDSSSTIYICHDFCDTCYLTLGVTKIHKFTGKLEYLVDVVWHT